MTGLAVVLASIALLVAITAVVLGVVLMVQNGETTSQLRDHRRAHAEAHGHPDPRLDRRQVNLGAPRTTGERRRAHIDDSTAHDAPVLQPADPRLPGAHRLPRAEPADRVRDNWTHPDPTPADDRDGTDWRTRALRQRIVSAAQPATVEHAPPTTELPRRPQPGPRP
jgi:hypothetical protein